MRAQRGRAGAACLDQRSGVERRVLQRAHDSRGSAGLGVEDAPHEPAGPRRLDGDHREALATLAAGADRAGDEQSRAVATRDVVGHRDPAARGDARPGPAGECALQRLVAGVGVEVGDAAEMQRRAGERDLGAGGRRDGHPAVAAGAVERDRVSRALLGPQADGSGEAATQRGGALVEVDDQRVALPADRARAQDQLAGAPREGAGATLGEHPRIAGRRVEGDVDGRVRQGIGAPAAPRAGCRVERREHAAEHGDDADGRAAVVAHRVEVPPGVAAGRDREVEARSSITLVAASLPLCATIGMPAPGCALPPQR